MSANDFTKVIRVGTNKEGYDVFCKITFVNERLSITGVEGPKRGGNAEGSCGQIIMSYKEYDNRGYESVTDINPAPDWDTSLIKEFFDIWDEWHLNDMKAGTPKQEKIIKKHEKEFSGYPVSHYEWACALLADNNCLIDNGYKYGTAWLKEYVPNRVIEFLWSLPDTDKQPAWI